MKLSTLPSYSFPYLLRAQHLIHFAFLLSSAIITYCSLNNSSPADNSYYLNAGSDSTNLVVSPVPYDVVFVTRKIVKHGSFNMDTLTDMPGVGIHSRFRVCAPGKLQVFKTNGTVVTLIDGGNPTAASLNLIDVNAPDVSYDGTQILFAGLTAPAPGTTYDTLPKTDIGGWRIYRINTNGTGLTQLTFTDMVINNSQFNNPGYQFNNYSQYSDIDPVWMPDGRICFSSSRAPSTSDYGGSRTTNLWVMNGNGTGMHRITSERNAAERPMIDPLTGRIVFSRWWRNARFPLDDMSTLANASGTGYIRKDGLSSNQSVQSYAANFIHFNGWVAASINPDGTDLKLFAGGRGDASDFIMYGGSFTSTSNLVSNSFAMSSLFNEGGFGGLVTHVRGAGENLPLAGYSKLQSASNAPPGTHDTLLQYYSANGYASDAHVLPDDRVLFSYAADYNQDYGLYVINANGTNRTLVYEETGTQQLRAKTIRTRLLAPIITDKITQVASLYPPLEAGPYTTDGTFVFKCLNVYTNGPVDMDITNGVKIGDAGSIRFFIHHQRKRKGSSGELDWPILLSEMQIPANGAVTNPSAPANQPLFEQLRTPASKGYTVPLTGNPFPSSTAHVAGMNYGRPGDTLTCVGCHRGHSMIPLPANQAEAEFTNLAPGATVTISAGTSNTKNYINDRCVMLSHNNGRYWITPYGYDQNQWTRLKFPVSIKIKNVRLYNIPQGGFKNSTLQITSAQVNLYADAARTQLVATQTVNQNLSNTGTDVNFNNVIAKVVEVKILGYTGTFNNLQKRVGLAEVEVIASGDISSPRLAEAYTNEPNIVVWPNPSGKYIFLKTSDEVNNNTEYKIYNTSGVCISSGKMINNSINEGFEKIDISNFANGLYIITVRSGDINRSARFMKM